MAEGFTSVEDREILGKALALAADNQDTPRTSRGDIEPGFESLLHQIVYFATGDDANWDEPGRLLERAVEFWKSTEIRPLAGDIVCLNLAPATNDRPARMILEIATEDKPFLVDSITGALADAGRPVSFFVNAVIDVSRNDTGARCEAAEGPALREAMIRAEMDPPVDAKEMEELRGEIERVLSDVRLAVEDWEPMRARLAACIAQLERTRPLGVDREELREAIEFLKWLWDNRFAFLGVRRYRYSNVDGAPTFERDTSGDLGIAKDPEKRILKSTYLDDGTPSPQVLHFMQSGEPILIAKANAKSTVHRRVHMDYLGVKSYSVDGRITGEERFVGLFTADAYNRPASDIPLLRAKVRRIAEGAGFVPGGHNEKAVLNILETFPRDEMFQSDIDSLRENALGVLRLYKRPRAKLFLRRDRFDRFVSALVFIPRDRFSSTVREQIGALLSEAFEGWVAAFSPHFGDAALVRVHYIIGINPGAPEGPGVEELTRRLRDITRSWSDALLDAMRAENKGATSNTLFNRYERAFDAGYREANSPEQAIADIAALEALGSRRADLSVYRKTGEPSHGLRLRLYSGNADFHLSDLIPKMENLGLRVVTETGYRVRPSDGDAVFDVNDFYVEDRNARPIDLHAVKDKLKAAFLAILTGHAEDDGFNALVIQAGLNWREAAVMRAAARHALQTEFPASQGYIEETLARHPSIARGLIEVFRIRFDPTGPSDLKTRATAQTAAAEIVTEGLQEVQSLDEDRIIRRFLNFFDATTRTSFYQRLPDGAPKPYISFKIDTKKLAEAPDPKPHREIFVSGPRVDGVHLRFGPVARGGLRWSDRREDFRTEVLGLVKAQRVKNAVIVPSGAKGCFYPKQLPEGDRAAIFDEGRAAYCEFIRGLLDVTDNIISGKTMSPPDVVAWDEPDPYLVVAADKGTATFSDTANAISEEYGFWLGDAFASGGSEGYDHKEMGITARGGWEAVKRHFREMDKDIQTEPFTAAGVGDMSGDVFGNGMLLSKQTRLLAAFDHRDIFIDPNPDPETSWTERKRLFDTPRTSWKDYDPTLISKGGGVFSRAAKTIPLSPEMKALLRLEGSRVAPNDVIRAILKADVELFWLGGIGTYFKAPTEDNWRVGDRANDAIRINADEMNMKVVGEGANLGLTQKARITFARAGGRVNTDAIDNSAGVDSSDHEVNIKILLSSAIERGELKAEERSDLLRDMTETVATHVLRNNYQQTRALTSMQSNAARDLDAHARMMMALEREGRLDRALEDLPDDKRITAMKRAGDGLSRPELAVLLAYAKMELFDAIVASKAPDDPTFDDELSSYFPARLHAYDGALKGHRLRREIIATRLSNEIVNTCGAAFAQRAAEATGAGLAQIALAYEGARRILDLAPFAQAVDALDNVVPAATQTALYGAASSLLSEVIYQLLHTPEALDAVDARGVAGLVEGYRDAFEELRAAAPSLLSKSSTENLQARIEDWREKGAPDPIAKEAALLPILRFAMPIIVLARRTSWRPAHAGALFFAAGDTFHVEAAYEAARGLYLEQHYDRLAMRRLTDCLIDRQIGLAANAAHFAGDAPAEPSDGWAHDLIGQWREAHDGLVVQFEEYAESLDPTSNLGVGKVTLFDQKLAELVDRTRRRPMAAE
ncbi:MAG: NAD-glutamate dehydrogenase [Pseudomonadota bacterium]